jgi:uncharacterized membrane protein YdbT with pleckstrin-like domain
MFIERNIPNRQPDEKLVLFIRRHWIVLVARWIVYIVLAFIPVGLYFFLLTYQPQILNNKIIFPFLFLFASIFYLFLWLFLFNIFIDYYLDVWIVTNKRILDIEQKGIFNRIVAEHSLDRIQDVTGSQKGVIQTLFKFGDVYIQTAGEIQRFDFHQVKNPFEIVRIVNNLLQKKEDRLEHEIADKIHPDE